MNRVHFVVAATLISTTMFAGAGAAQSTQLTPICWQEGRRRLKGEVADRGDPAGHRPPAKNIVQTTVKVKNASDAPVARLVFVETWYDAGGQVIAGGRMAINGLQPGEIQTMTIETPFSAKMKSNQFNFTQANGTVKATKVKSLDEAPATAKAKRLAGLSRVHPHWHKRPMRPCASALSCLNGRLAASAAAPALSPGQHFSNNRAAAGNQPVAALALGFVQQRLLVGALHEVVFRFVLVCSRPGRS